MKRILAATAIVAACLAPLATAKANTFCTTGPSLVFCGSVEVGIAHSPSGTTQVTIRVLNTSGFNGIGDPTAVFTSIALTDVTPSSFGTLGNFSVMIDGDLTNYASGTDPNWALTTPTNGTGTFDVDINASTIPGSTVQYGVGSGCNVAKRLNTGGIGTCGLTYPRWVTISFTSNASFSADDIYIKAQSDNGSRECDWNIGTGVSSESGCGGGTTTVPEPASIVLVGTGLMALGRRANRWRRRNQNV